MRHILYALLLTAAPAWADWVQIDADAQRTTFADPAGARRSGEHVRMTVLVEHARFQRMVEVGYFSQKFLFEYDCKAGSARRLGQTFHAGHMGDGSVVYSDEAEQDWMPAAEGSVVWRLLSAACGR